MSKLTASVELTADTLIDTVWFLAWEQTDWLAIVYRDSPSSKWTMFCRFRYYHDGTRDDAFDGKDEKSGYRMQAEDGARLVETTSVAADTLQQHTHGRLWTLKVNGNSKRYIELLKQQPWAHMKTMDAL